jgi:N-hydroxyarylamine O-acetyltransferase
MEPGSLRLDAYFERIGHRGDARPGLANLAAIHALHAAAIPFENLSPLLGEAVKLDIESLQDKLVARRRGGWCFEQNLLFAHVLRAMGYPLKTLAARVRWNVLPHVTSPRSHCLLLVEAEGERRIADVGFGGLILTAPLRLEAGTVQDTPHEAHRLVALGEGFGLEALVAGNWARLYDFELHEQLQADYEVSSWYLANHPQSPFVGGLVCARAEPGRRHALRNTRYAVHYPDGSTDRRFITELEDMRRVLRDELRIALPLSPQLDAALQRVIDANPPA